MMDRLTRGKTQTYAWLAGWGLVAGQPVPVSGTLPFIIQDVDGAELFGLFMFLRQPIHAQGQDAHHS